MAPRTRRQAAQRTDLSEGVPQQPRRTTRSTSSSQPKAQPAQPPRRPRSKKRVDSDEVIENGPSSTDAAFQPIAVSSPRGAPDTSEDRVEDLLNKTGNDSLQSVQCNILVPLESHAPTTSSPKRPVVDDLPPSSPPSRIPSSSSESVQPAPLCLPPSKILGRSVRRPGVVRSRAQATAQPEPERDPSLSPSSDPFGFFALEKKIRSFRSQAKDRVEQQMQQEAEALSDEPSLQFSDGVPFATPLRRRLQEEESMAEVDAVLANVTNVVEQPEADEVLSEAEADEPKKQSHKPRRKLEVARLPRRKPRSTAKSKKSEQENIASEQERKNTTRKATRSKATLGKRHKVQEISGDEIDERELRAREKRRQLYDDLANYALEEELVI